MGTHQGICMKGRVAVLKPGKRFELREFAVPDPEPGATIVRMSMAGVCGSDLHTWRGDHGDARPISASGHLLGHEGTGVIHALGSGLDTDFAGEPLREGDRVVFSAIRSCQHCVFCLAGDEHLCSRRVLLNARAKVAEPPYFVNTYADYVYLEPKHAIFKVAPELADEELTAVNCAMGTVMQGLQSAGARQGQALVVQGAGGLGLYAIAIAKDMGLSSIVAVDSQRPRLELAKELGAAETLDITEMPAAEDRVNAVLRATGNRGADIVLELAGFGELVQEGIDMLAPGGTYVEIGNLMQNRTATITPASLLRGKRILGSGMYRPAILPTVLDFLRRNHDVAALRRVVSHKFPLANIDEAFRTSEWSGRDTPVIRSALIP